MTEIQEMPTRRTSIGSQRNPASEEAILVAAEELLREGGLAAFSIEAVARRAKAGKPTIYRWWPSKAALLLDVYHRQKDDMPHPDTGDIRRDMEMFLGGLLKFWREEGGGIFRSVIAEAQSDPAASVALSQYYAERLAQTGMMVRRAQKRGDVSADVTPEIVVEMLSSFAWTRLLTDRLDCTDAEIATVVGTILHGIAANPQ